MYTETETSPEEIGPVPGRISLLLARVKRRLRLVRRSLLAGSLIALLLALIPMQAGPEVPREPAMQSLQQKMRQVESQLTEGRPHQLRLNEGELFWWLHSQSSRRTASQAGEEHKPLLTSLELEGISVGNDRLNLHTAFSVFGKKMTLQVTGKPRLEHSHLDLDVAEARLGYLPIPGPVFSWVWGKLLDGPLGMRDRRLPVQVSQIELEPGELIVHYADFVSSIL